MKKMICLMGVIFVSGCSHAPQRCTGVIAHSSSEYDVCIGGDKVSEGDRVAFFRESCMPPSRGSAKQCRKEKVGTGAIVKVLDEHLSTVKLDSEFEVSEKLTIEKL